jgi:hypothetical protein
MRARQRIPTYCAAYLAAIWIIALLPLVSVLLEIKRLFGQKGSFPKLKLQASGPSNS